MVMILILLLIFFYKELKNCSHIIAHNIGFDINVIKSELFRRNLYHIIIELDKKILICSMKKFKNTIKAKFKHNTNKIKDPSLKELYKFAFNKEIENAHNSKFDVINLHAANKKNYYWCFIMRILFLLIFYFKNRK